MYLTDLYPNWLETGRRRKVGIAFQCPCGCHRGLIVAFENPEDGQGSAFPNMHAMMREGYTFENLTLRGLIDRSDGCGWRGYIEDGKVLTARNHGRP